MNNRLEKYQNQGCFSSYSVNPIHKSRLENFIKRNKLPETKDKSPPPPKSKSPLLYRPAHTRERSARISSSNKLLEIAQKEAELLSKEAQLKEKEPQLIKLTHSFLAKKYQFEPTTERSALPDRSHTPVEKKEKLLSVKVFIN